MMSVITIGMFCD